MNFNDIFSRVGVDVFECFASLEMYNWQFTLHRPEFAVASAAWRHIRGPRQGVFLHIHCGIAGQGAFPVGQRVESEKPAQCPTTSGTTTHFQSHAFNSIRARGGLQAICLHVSEEFSRTTWGGCSRVFSSSNAINQTSCVLKRMCSLWSLSLKPMREGGGHTVLGECANMWVH